MSHSRYFAGRDEKNEEKLAHLLAALPPYCKDYFRGIRPATTSMTRVAYAYDLSMFFTFLRNSPDASLRAICEAERPECLSAITKQDVECYLEYLEGNDASPDDGPRNRTQGIRRRFSSLKSFLSYFCEAKAILSSPEELDEACSAAYAAMQESLAWLKQVEKTLNGKKELQRQVLAYSKTRPVRDGLKQQKNAKAKAAYRQKHESDFIIADAAARYFRENGISKLPSYKSLQAEIESLIKEKNSGYNDYRAKREEYRRLQTVKGNIDQILHRERKPVKRQEQER